MMAISVVFAMDVLEVDEPEASAVVEGLATIEGREPGDVTYAMAVLIGLLLGVGVTVAGALLSRTTELDELVVLDDEDEVVEVEEVVEELVEELEELVDEVEEVLDDCVDEPSRSLVSWSSKPAEL